MLTAEIKKQFKEVIQYSQKIYDPKVDALLEQWEKAKNKFYDYFLSGKLIREVGKVSFELGEDSKKERLDNFICWIDQLGCCLDNLCHFLSWLGPNEFFNNRTESDYVVHSSTDPKTIQKGTKVVKAFKYFVTDTKLLEDLQNKASALIQENKIEGTLCFSIHPLDYLSLSENQFNWRSCHALDGEYRAGNLSYMTDPHTIICYLKSDNDVILPRFPDTVPWNNKKWRCLFFFNDMPYPELIFAGRQYPFFAESALTTIRDSILTYLPQQSCFGHIVDWTPWYHDYIEGYKFDDGFEVEFPRDLIPLPGSPRRIEQIVKDTPDSMHFNDLLYSSCYKPYYMYTKRYNFHTEGIKFTIGGKVDCMYCGEEIINSKDTMMCPDCECKYGHSEDDDYRYCDCCNTRFLSSEAYWVDDDEICPACAAEQTFVCPDCGMRVYNHNQKYDTNDQRFICRWCYEDKYADLEEGEEPDGERTDSERLSASEDFKLPWE